MPTTSMDKVKTEVTLGTFLAAVRADRHLTLRQVEEATDKEVSNAYLSQLENDKISKPSPNVLYALATVYAVDYDKLMELAGYITTAKKKDGARHGRAATFAELNLNEEEEAAMLKYLQFLRSSK